MKGETLKVLYILPEIADCPKPAVTKMASHRTTENVNSSSQRLKVNVSELDYQIRNILWKGMEW